MIIMTRFTVCLINGVWSWPISKKKEASSTLGLDDFCENVKIVLIKSIELNTARICTDVCATVMNLWKTILHSGA